MLHPELDKLMIGFLLLFFFYSFGNAELSIIAFPVLVVGYGFMRRSLMEDERNNAIRLLVSLPIERRQIVKAKYASILLVTILVFAVFWLAGIALGLAIPNTPDKWGPSLVLVSLFFFVFMLFLSLYLPFVYKLGFVRTQSIYRFIFVGIFALGFSASALITKIAERFGNDGNPPAWLDRIAVWVSGINPYTGVFITLFAGALLYLVSMAVSIKCFENREFV